MPSAPLALLLAFAPLVRAQAAVPDDRVHVYLDCSSCDPDYIRTEVPFVEYVRDRAQAQVHLLVTEAAAGGGGQEFTASFLGQGPFAGSSDTLRALAPPGEAYERTRHRLARLLRLGLVRFAAHSGAAEGLSVAFEGPAAATRTVSDPWNHWVFTTALFSDLSGEKARRELSLRPEFAASRVTAEHKLTLSWSSSYTDSHYDFGGGSTLRTVSRSYNGAGLYVYALGEHWSAGGKASADSSTFGNIAHAWEAGPAVEFDVFPYSESTRRQCRILYELENRSVRYYEPTIYGRLRESLVKQELSLSLERTEPWGSAWAAVTGVNYPEKAGKSRFEVSGNLILHVVEGLSLRVGGVYTRIRDQFALPAGGATQQDILLQRQELESQYSFTASTGISYTFGSVFNGIVNPRFGH